MEKKSQLLKLVIENVESRLKALIQSALDAHDAATSPESKAENKYDTRGLEASYLAGAQSKRAKELEESLFYLNKINTQNLSKKSKVELYSVVNLVDDDGVEKNLFILPVQGGVNILLESKNYSVLTLSSPLGKSIYQKILGDEIFFKSGKKETYYEIKEVY